jgi:hypothetical protein
VSGFDFGGLASFLRIDQPWSMWGDCTGGVTKRSGAALGDERELCYAGELWGANEDEA